MATITAVPKPHNEFMCGVQFVDGVGRSERPSTLDYFRRRGYPITEEPVPSPTPGDDWTLAALHDYASTNGINLEGATRKDDILERLTAPAVDVDTDTAQD